MQEIEIIAEIGVNHDGSLDKALNLISMAAECGATAVKFQTFSAAELALHETPKVNYQKNTTSDNETHFEMLQRLELSRNDFFEIKSFCEQLNIKFISTPYHPSAVDLLEDIGVSVFKVASADLVDDILLKRINRTKKPVLLSVGMADLEEIDHAIRLLSNCDVTLLHCVSNYPCDEASLNLRVMKELKKRYNLPVGFSDHSEKNNAVCIAIALGASVIERHFTYDTKAPGPDHAASSDPAKFKNYVNHIMTTIKILGDPNKKTQDEELGMKAVSRKSLYYSEDLPAGQKLLERNLVLRRPGAGLYAKELGNLVGRVLQKSVSKNTLASLNDVK